MKVAVIIVSYNFEPWMDRCLGSLRESTLPVTVWVVDNASTDQTVSLIRANYPEVNIIQNTSNKGFGAANNQGMAEAIQKQFDYAFLLNQDAWVDENTIETLVKLGENHPEFGIISPVHLTGKGDELDFGFADYAHLTTKDLLPSAEFTEVNFVNAAFWMIPVRILCEVGGFSPLFYHYGEDVDFVNRMHYHHYKIVYAPVFGYHDRERRIVTKPMEYRAKTVYLMTAFANPNHSFSYCFVKAIGGGCEQIVNSIRTHDWKGIWVYLKYTLGLLVKTPQILRVRNMVKQKSKTFIQ